MRMRKRKLKKVKEGPVDLILPTGPGIGLKQTATEVEERSLEEYEEIASIS